MSMIKQRVENRAQMRGRKQSAHVSVRKKRETAFSAGCKMLASSKYLAKHSRPLMVMAVACAKEQNLLDQNMKQYKEKWIR